MSLWTFFQIARCSGARNAFHDTRRLPSLLRHSRNKVNRARMNHRNDEPRHLHGTPDLIELTSNVSLELLSNPSMLRGTQRFSRHPTLAIASATFAETRLVARELTVGIRRVSRHFSRQTRRVARLVALQRETE